MKQPRIYVTLGIVFLLSAVTSTYACTCVRPKNWTLKYELSKATVAVKGRIISGTDYNDPDFQWSLKLFKLVVDRRYKAPAGTPDTLSILTGRDSGLCGYAFKLGHDYIVYATGWNPTGATPDESKSGPNAIFQTDICTATKESNRKELAQLRRLTR
ncbi:hypothetical protein [uncultured Spirosoma sp.]|uniref:hypothetical protein n=1 Tax=uncultured Spirosoma sp. TaxID=278208 RepID=UPI00258F8247|nr:hypothetical protein [uncultured Spirosoma sp.]